VKGKLNNQPAWNKQQEDLWLLGLVFFPEDGGCAFHRNIDKITSDYTALHLKKLYTPHSSVLLLCYMTWPEWYVLVPRFTVEMSRFSYWRVCCVSLTFGNSARPLKPVRPATLHCWGWHLIELKSARRYAALARNCMIFCGHICFTCLFQNVQWNEAFWWRWTLRQELYIPSSFLSILAQRNDQPPANKETNRLTIQRTKLSSPSWLCNNSPSQEVSCSVSVRRFITDSQEPANGSPLPGATESRLDPGH
jgi:hypothetical protein